MSDIDRLAVYAARYAIGRRTHAVRDVCEVLAAHRSDLTERTRQVIVRDITEAEEREGLGDAVDARDWRALRDVLR